MENIFFPVRSAFVVAEWDEQYINRYDMFLLAYLIVLVYIN